MKKKIVMLVLILVLVTTNRCIICYHNNLIIDIKAEYFQPDESRKPVDDKSEEQKESDHPFRIRVYPRRTIMGRRPNFYFELDTDLFNISHPEDTILNCNRTKYIIVNNNVIWQTIFKKRLKQRNKAVV